MGLLSWANKSNMENFNDLAAFAAVAKERSFTRAAAKLGVSPSALSQTIRNLEERLGLRLLTRTTRSVAPTEAGERLLRTVVPALRGDRGGTAALSELREKPAGTSPHHGRRTPGDFRAAAGAQAVSAGLSRHQVEIIVDYGLTDIVADGYDAGVRWASRSRRT